MTWFYLRALDLNDNLQPPAFLTILRCFVTSVCAMVGKRNEAKSEALAAAGEPPRWNDFKDGSRERWEAAQERWFPLATLGQTLPPTGDSNWRSK